MTTWKAQLEKQARLLIREIVMLEGSLGSDYVGSSLQSLYETLERIYSNDMSIADLRDRSDLILKLRGEALEDGARLQLVTSILENVTGRVTDLTKVMLGEWAEGRVTPSSLDLALSGMARGSLLLGLTTSLDKKGRSTLLGDKDTLFVSTQRALQTIDIVSHIVDEREGPIELEEVSEQVVDPMVRDAALLAVQRLAPSGRRGIDTLTVIGQDGPPAMLTAEHRKAIRDSLLKPVIHGDDIQLAGYVREIDLDAHRFELRGIDDQQIRDVRCAYRDLAHIRARDLLGSYIRVRGLVERTADGVPRLLSVLDIEILQHPREEIYLVDDGERPLPLLRGPNS
jgi:hypothetical protein